MIQPVRIQLRRTAGFRLQEISQALNGREAVKVTRGKGAAGKWGNPYAIELAFNRGFMVTHLPTGRIVVDWCEKEREAVESAVRLFETFALCLPVHELRGKNLACFCPLDAPCHADVLLALANDLKPRIRALGVSKVAREAGVPISTLHSFVGARDRGIGDDAHAAVARVVEALEAAHG